MNIRIPYILNPIHEGGKYAKTVITKNGEINKETIIRYRAIVYSPRIVINKGDIFG